MSVETLEFSVERLANTRDLVAKIIEVAGQASGPGKCVLLVLRDSQVSEARARKVFEETVSLLRPELASALCFQYLPPSSSAAPSRKPDIVKLPAQRNVRFELLRLLLQAKIEDGLPRTGSFLKDALGLSEHPIRAAGRVLESAGLIRTTHQGRELAIEPWECTPEVLSKVDARPFRVSYRFRAGAHPLSAQKLADRFSSVGSATEAASAWALSGSPAARLLRSDFALSGLPRVDLLVRVPIDTRSVDLAWLHEIAPRIEREPNPLELAPIVVEIVRDNVEAVGAQRGGLLAHRADIVLALLDQGLVVPARQLLSTSRSPS